MPSPLTIDSLHGPIRLLAGPGAGKTHALVDLYAELVARRLAGRGEILVLTFSASAAGELERRLEERLNDSYDEAWISTFHSFCRRLLHRHRPEPRRLLLSGFQEWVAMRTLLDELGPDSLGSLAPVRRSDAFAQDLIAFIALLKQNLVHPAPFALLAEASGTERMRCLASIYTAYQSRLEAAGLVDFRDLVAQTIGLLATRRNLLEQLRARFKYVLVDEFQDVDPAQFELLRMLAPPAGRPRLLVAGDPEQSIYGFRGTVPKLLSEEFPLRYQPQRLGLEDSHRCPPEVLAAASRLLDATQPSRQGRRPGSAAASPELPVLRVVRQPDSVEEAFFAARELRRQVLEEGLEPGRCAILLRSTSTLAVPFEEALRAFGLPYEIRGVGAMARNEVVRHLLTYLRALGMPDDDEALERLLSSGLSGGGRRLVGRLRRHAIEEGRAFHKVVRQFMYRLAERDPAGFPLPWAPAAGGPGAATAEPAPSTGEASPEPDYMAFIDEDEARALHSALRSFHTLAREARGVPLQALAYRILDEAGVFEHLFRLPVGELERDDALVNLRAALDAFADLERIVQRLSGEGPRLEAVAAQLDLLIAKAVDETEATTPTRQAVQIMTVHQAKGLEFDTVFLAGFAQGQFPLSGRPHPLLEEADQTWLETELAGFRPSWPASSADHLAEEARLAYVAMTRARRRLYLTYAEEYDQTAGPSSFIEMALPGAQHETPGGSTASLDAQSFLTRSEAETLLAREATTISPGERDLLAGLGLGLDLEFIFDPHSGQPFEPYRDSRPEAVDPGHFSPTTLNDYLKCPRLYWYNHHPGLVSAPRGVELERGSFLHRVLEDFHRRESEWRHLPADSQREWLEAALQEHLERYLARVENTLERKAEEQEVRRILENYIQFATRFQPIRRLGTLATELKFHVTVDGREVRGKIDRINDTGEGTCEVVDYKTGRGQSAQRAFETYFGADLYDVQLAMYHLACAEGVDDEGSPIALRPRYLSLWYPKDLVYGQMRQVLFAVDEPAPGVKDWLQRVVGSNELKRARGVVEGAIRGIGSGDFRPRPKPGAVGTCLSWFGCPHASVCPFGGQPPE